MLCTIDDVRKLTKKLSQEEVTDVEITNYIVMATNIVAVDLSSIIDSTTIQSISDSLALKLLCSYKTCELLLSAYYGASRKIDEVTDIQFFQKLYDKLLKNILNGNIIVDGKSTVTKKYPALNKVSHKLYNIKGVKGFYGDDENSLIDAEYDE